MASASETGRLKPVNSQNTLAFVPTQQAKFWARIEKLNAWVTERSPRQAYGLSFLAGICASLAMPPAFFLPVLWVSFPLLILLLNRAENTKEHFLHGWFFGFGLFLTSLYWIPSALLVFSDDLLWMVPFAALGLPAVLSVFTATATALAGQLPVGPARVFGLAACWFLMELARSHLFTGFPWNLMGHAWAGSESLLQFASYGGIYGLSALVLLSAVLPVLALPQDGTNREEEKDRVDWIPDFRFRQGCLGLAVLIPIAVAGTGFARLSNAPGPGIADTPGVGLRLIQANIPQPEKWPAQFRTRNFMRHVELSERDRPDWITTVVWPETAAAFFLSEDEPALKRISQMIPEGGYLLTGAPRRSTEPFKLFNSVLVIDDQAKVAAHYDKSHLVPFGEYVPFRDFLKFAKVTAGGIDYSPGNGPETMAVENLPAFSPLVCYEIIFPGNVTSAEGPRPDWLLNLTNDAWYGETAGPHQHLTMARLRAVEQGLPLIRSTNTGITVAFDGYGRELGRLPLVEEGYLDLRLPQPLPATPFSRFESVIPGILLAMLLMLTLWAHRFGRKAP